MRCWFSGNSWGADDARERTWSSSDAAWVGMQDHALAAEYERCTDALKDVVPITPEIKAILHTHYGYDTTPVRSWQGSACSSAIFPVPSLT